MSSVDSNDKVGGKGHEDSRQSPTRRRLLKAAAATPVVATLHPGASIANASAFQCMNHDGDFSTAKFAERGDSLHGDNAVRKEVTYFCYGGVCNAGGVGSASQGSGSNGSTGLPNELFADDVYDANSVRYLWARSGGRYTVIGNADDPDHFNGATITRDQLGAYTQRRAHVLKLYRPWPDQTGVDEVSIYPIDNPETSNLQALTATCMDSISPNVARINL